MKTKTLLLYLIFLSVTGAAQTPELMVNSGHSEYINSVSFSPDGKTLMSASIDKTIKLWDIKSGCEIRTFIGNSLNVEFVFSSDGDQMASIENDKLIKVWDVTSGKELMSFSGHTDRINSIVFSVDGKTIASASDDKTLRVWDINTGKVALVISKFTNAVENVAISPDNKYIASSSNGYIKFWDFNSGQEIRSIYISSKQIGFTKDGTKLFYIEDGTLKYLEILSGNITVPIVAKNCIYITENGKYAWVPREKDVTVFEVNTQKEINTINCEIEKIMVVSPDGHYLATTSWDKSIKLWDVASGKLVKTLKGNSSAVKNVDFTADMKHIISGSSDSIIRFLDINSSMNIKTFFGQDNWGFPLDISPDGRSMVCITKERTIVIKDISTSQVIKTLGACDEVFSLKYSNDGRSVICACDNGDISLWSVDSGALLQSFKGYRSADVSSDSRYIVSKINREALVVRDVNSGKEVLKVSDNKEIKDWGIFTLSFSHDGGYIAGGSFSKNVYLWQTNITDNFKHAPSKVFKTLVGHTKRVTSVDFSPSGEYLVSGGDDNNIKLWNVATGVEIATLKGHTNSVRSVRFSPDGNFIISGSEDYSIRIWDVKRQVEVIKFYYFGKADWVVVTPDGRFDGSQDGMKQLHYVKGMDVIPLESRFEQFYTPGLLAQVLGGAVISKPNIELSQMSLPPEVKILTPENNSSVSTSSITVTVQATDKGGGVDEIRLYHNGKLLDGTQRGFKATGQNKEFVISLTDGENRIKATAYNTQRTEAIPCEIIVNYKTPQPVKPNMYILAIGINNYLNPKYNLNFAKNDADAFVQSLKTGAEPIFGKVEVTLLSDASATRAGIMDAIERIRSSAKTEDVFVFYYAGHGVMSTGSETEKSIFYLVPHDVTKMYEADDMLKKSGISATEIGEFSKNIKAQKQLFVLDACQSGGAMQTLAMRGAAEEKSIAQLARSTGTYFIAASGTEQFATEVAELGHGIFTYAIIEAIKGACQSQDGRITVNLLKSCIETNVPELSKKYKGQPQFPTGYGFGQDFPIVIVK